MSELTFPTGDNNIAWQTERREMAAMVRKHILDPLALMAGIFQEERPANLFPLELEDAGSILQLMIEGAHVELSLYSSSHAGTANVPLSCVVEDVLEEPSTASGSRKDEEATEQTKEMQ